MVMYDWKGLVGWRTRNIEVYQRFASAVAAQHYLLAAMSETSNAEMIDGQKRLHVAGSSWTSKDASCEMASHELVQM